MAYFGSTEWYQKVAAGDVPGHSIIHKFGASDLSTTFHPISNGNVYQTPTTATALEVVSDSASDTAAGAGARQITVVGLDSAWNEQTVIISTNGLTPVPLGVNFIRVYRWYVSQSGTYATQTAGSHVGNLTIRAAGGGATWAVLLITPFPVGQSQIGCYTVPTGYDVYLLSKDIFVDAAKTADLYFFKREHPDDVTPPYDGIMRLVEREVGITGGYSLETHAPKYLGAGPMDVGFMGSVKTGTGECSVEFELLLVEI